ncbi:MAG: PAAR domain-containing protein [Janthinobacterium lividum]
MPNAPAARITDQVKHSEAMSFRRIGGGIGSLLGCAAGCLLVGAAMATEVVTVGMATPLVAVAVYVGAGLVIAGSTASGASMISNQGAHIGQKIPGSDEGPIASGIDSILIGPDKQSAAYLGSKVLCNNHKHTLPNSVEFIVQGSKTVRYGSGRFPAARVGDKGTCDFTVGQGCESVIIGGDTLTVGKIDLSGDDPEAAFFDKVGKYGGVALLIGTSLLAVPAGFAAGGAWGALRAAAWAGLKFKLVGDGTSKLINQLPDGQVKDTLNSLMSVAPLFHAGGEGTSGEGTSGEGESGGGSEPTPAGEPTPARETTPER